MRRLFAVIALIALLMPAVNAQTTPQGTTDSPITVENAWARATSPAATTGAVYLTIVDHGAPDRVIGFATPVAETAQLHETTMQGNIMKMRQIDGLALTAQAPVTLAPGGYHVMLMGLRAPLRQGQTFPLSVTFRNAGTVEITVAVAGVGAAGPGQTGPGHDMDMHHDMDMSKPMSPQSK